MKAYEKTSDSFECHNNNTKAMQIRDFSILILNSNRDYFIFFKKKKIKK